MNRILFQIVGKLENLKCVQTIKTPNQMEVQKHGFQWEKDLIYNLYGATEQELKEKTNYTSKVDLPGSLNRLDGVDISIKTTKTENAVCMGDCLRVYDSVCQETPLHMTVIHYQQVSDKKKLKTITQVNLTGSLKLLFGNITREQLEELDRAVKAIPQKRSPTKDEKENIYAIRDAIQEAENNSAIHLDIKCNSTQSRLQCSFNRFQKFLEENPDRIIAHSKTGDFRGKKVLEEICSKLRVFKKQYDSELSSPPI
jgi:hypothetical protein